MKLEKLTSIFLIFLAVSTAKSVWATIPDFDQSTITREYSGPETVVMFNVPDGSGSSFTKGSILGSTVDATITLTLILNTGVPVANFPAEDCWLMTIDGGLLTCNGGTTADSSTDEFGVTKWISPLRAGGSSEASTVVVVSGAQLVSAGLLAISHNSPDINDDGLVNLTDIPLFAGDFYSGQYVFRADFAYDGVVNLSDLVKFSQALGTNCDP